MIARVLRGRQEVRRDWRGWGALAGEAGMEPRTNYSC